ncbi:peptidyl-prolyl cis-trans isomerase [Altericroceibacterium endophyticum]|uniref:Parvulin-like PPIase n=1 Tax=Altericroceibacterium endophyticum TaxID=1808508 RepID=A0A6I4T3X6_9SPHN|nr:peptidyl-prolyl cis-trans isomerase [Altericroceibacterium endophyticum]MXO65974.1 peptidylprolyl isomerase [Altericroceibacterium endophyticum]
MLQLFRNFFKSKIGIGVTLGFLVLIALAFASSDVATTGTFGGVSGGDRVAVVGGEKIGTADLSMNASNALDMARQQDPKVTMEAFIAQGGLDEVLNQMISRTALSEFARSMGLRAGGRLVDSEILQIQSFKGPDGSFDEDLFRATLQRRGLTESAVRDDMSKGLLSRQVITPVTFGASIPEYFAVRYASLLQEKRDGAIAIIPSRAFAPEGDPTDEQLKSYYAAHRENYIRPERRVIRYATFGEDALSDLRAPTDAEIAARYEQNKAQYAASESRRFTQLVVPTEAAAKAVLDTVNKGSSLAAAAKQNGLATTTIGPVTKSELAEQASAAVAKAGFAVSRGETAQPARGGLGWYILRVDSIDKKPARSLDQVRGDISSTLAQEQKRRAIADLSAQIEDELDQGKTLSDLVKELGLTLQTSKPLTADGNVYGTADSAPEVLSRALATAFDMRENEAQIAEVDPGKTFLIFDVDDITESAAAPLADIRDDVTAAWRMSQGSDAAKKAAERVMKRVKEGSTLAAALKKEETTLPPPDAISMSREQLVRSGQVPPVLALLFSMAEGTVKRLEAPNMNGWFIVQLDDIEAGKVDAEDQMVKATVQNLGTTVGDEYAQQFIAAVEEDIGAERNAVAIDAVRKQLTGLPD